MMRRLGALLGLALALMVAGTGVGLTLEQNDSFCATCHTEPETTYVRQAQATPNGRPATLAAFHARSGMAAGDPGATRCIDCHGGVGTVGRLRTLYELGVSDSLIFATGRHQQPATTTQPLADIQCAQCHADALAVPGFENHFHSKLTDPQAPRVACVDCHLAHSDRVEPREKYIRRAVIYPRCNDCHARLGGPTNLR